MWKSAYVGVYQLLNFSVNFTITIYNYVSEAVYFSASIRKVPFVSGCWREILSALQVKVKVMVEVKVKVPI
jgi:hypothetical protein